MKNMVEAALWYWHVWLESETGRLIIIADVTADRSSRMNYDVYRAVLSAQTNTEELMGPCKRMMSQSKPQRQLKKS